MLDTGASRSTMAHILVMPDGNWLSHVSRPFEIAKVLRRRGHRVSFASDGEYMRLPAEAGFEVHPARALEPDHVLRCSRNGRANWWGLDEIESIVEDEMRVLNELRPDAVVGDFRLTLGTSSELVGVPYVSVLNASWTNYYDAPLQAPEHLPLTQLLGRGTTTFLLPWVKAWILWNDARPFRRYRRRRRLAPRGNIWDVWRGDLNLVVDAPSYGPTRGLPPDFRYVGPIVWEPEMPAPGWLDELEPQRPTLYFTMGSTGEGRFLELAMELFGGTDYQCLMTTAGLIRTEAAPENFHVVDYAPGSRLMEVADAVVCQGGNGTIYQALRRGVPIVGIPTMHDQEFNLDRVVALEAGRKLSEIRFEPSHLVDAVHEVLTNPRYREGASRQARELSAYDGPHLAADAIEELLARGANAPGRDRSSNDECRPGPHVFPSAR